MFEKASHKLKICSYIYFIGNILNQLYRDVDQLSQLNWNVNIMISMFFQLCISMVMFFVISLVIYSLGSIVEYFEVLKKRKMSESKSLL